jgi:hypothetical protein
VRGVQEKLASGCTLCGGGGAAAATCRCPPVLVARRLSVPAWIHSEAALQVQCTARRGNPAGSAVRGRLTWPSSTRSLTL